MRCMVSVLFMIGRGLERPEVIDYLLDVSRCPRKPEYLMSGEQPLVLHDCGFDRLAFKYLPGVLARVEATIEATWREAAMKV